MLEAGIVRQRKVGNYALLLDRRRGVPWTGVRRLGLGLTALFEEAQLRRAGSWRGRFRSLRSD
jgi:hypothetical protein